MIIHTIDHGWGPEWPIKGLEREILDQYLAPFDRDQISTLVINSTWYGDQQHRDTKTWLSHHSVGRIVLVSMIDSAIPNRTWFADQSACIYEVGSYHGPNEIVFWAMVLDRWFRAWPMQDLCDVSGIDCAFMCLNRKPHRHRVNLYNQLVTRDLLKSNLVTLGGSGDGATRTLDLDIVHQDLSPNSAITNHGIVNDNVSLGHIDNWRRHFVNVVTETQFDIDRQWFVSEKIFKPILGMRPFLVYDKTGAQAWLADHGFESYAKDFRDISDLDPSDPTHLADFLATLDKQGVGYWKKKYLDLLPKIRYNRQAFDDLITRTRESITQGIQCQI